MEVIFRGWTSIAKYCAKKLPQTIEVMALYNGKVIFSRCSKILVEGRVFFLEINCNLILFDLYTNVKNFLLIPGPSLDPKWSFCMNDNLRFRDNHSEFGESEISEISRFSFDGRDGNTSSKEDCISPLGRHKRGSLSSISLPAEDFTKQRPGWPLLQTASSVNQVVLEARKMSVVQWVMTLPHRPLSDFSESNSPTSCKSDDSLERDNGVVDKLASLQELPKDLELILARSLVGCKIFSHDIMRIATSEFSAG